MASRVLVVAAFIFACLLLVHVSLGLDCDAQVNGLVGNCLTAVMLGGNKPSPKCCRFVRAAEPDCVCPKISGDVTKVLKLGTALKIAKNCNRELPHNYQCGSYTLP